MTAEPPTSDDPSPRGEQWHSTTYGRPARRPARPPAAQAPGREQRLADFSAASAPARPATPAPARPARPAAPGGPARGSRPLRRRAVVRRRRLLAAVAVLLVLAVAYPSALAWRGWSSVQQVAAASTGERPAATPGTTYLIVGSDSRDGLTPEEIAEYSAGGDDIAGRRTDTIMLLHVPAGGGPSALISVPRDSYVPIPGHDSNKINAAYAIGGAPLLTETVENVSGLRIDHYVETGFGGFARIVDAVGGVEMCPAQAVDDVRAGLDIQAGCQEMGGATALGYARYRYSDVQGDLGRAVRQRELLAAITAKAASPATLLNPFRAFPLASSGGSAVTLDEEASLPDLVGFLRGMRAASGADGISMTVPVADPNLRTSHGLAVKWDTARALEMFEDLKRDDTEALRSLTA
ncbi:LCP family protein required for cell wall assembly [Kineococcus radiotolerans]|uniref:LCP family protein required for cell wall assembly n=1 Tax=Kineococcus radiotolerans TaxID=131568 RepID=A0A7W4TNM3_KINRA|nr:LCP family protein [Kineococcus radiotolerans]MBB2902241.1 LCP family protein required for cell wall assembly [Kineococcus radiotolerans]